MAAQEAEHFFDSVSDEGSPAAAASTTPEESPPQTTQSHAPWLTPEQPDIHSLQGFIESEEIRMAIMEEYRYVKYIIERSFQNLQVEWFESLKALQPVQLP